MKVTASSALLSINREPTTLTFHRVITIVQYFCTWTRGFIQFYTVVRGLHSCNQVLPVPGSNSNWAFREKSYTTHGGREWCLSQASKGQGKGLDTCYSATYTSQTRDQQRFISWKWQLIGTSQWCRSALRGHPLPALTDNWTHGAASRHTITPISHTRPSPRSPQ